MRRAPSGGPIVVGETLVGLNIGMEFGTQPTTFYVKITPILADINAKVATAPGLRWCNNYRSHHTPWRGPV
jgi:hypothetical protein